MAHIYVSSTGHEVTARDTVNQIRFMIEYLPARAEVSISEMPPVSGQSRIDVVRDQVRLLAQAMLEAAQDPQGITLSPPEQQ